jgi:hypothetical protein
MGNSKSVLRPTLQKFTTYSSHLGTKIVQCVIAQVIYIEENALI